MRRIAAFERAGAEWAHVVDLDGAREGARRQARVIERLAATGRMKIQCGGGVRSRDDVAALLDLGVARAIVGSAAIHTPDAVNKWIDEFGSERLCCAFDVRGSVDFGFSVSVDGWRRDGGVSLEYALGRFPSGGLKHILTTDISRDGALAGPNLGLVASVIARRPDLSVQASGGVSSTADIKALSAAGAAAAIVGRALYEKRFTLEAVLGG
jgi:phosphoribosylformimino-5-aminoimidazole carboxamide ribotide isomerase